VWYVEALFKTCNAGDWTFYDAIKIDILLLSLIAFRVPEVMAPPALDFL
jgi:hypothetical protein